MANEYCVMCGKRFGVGNYCTSCGSPRDDEFDFPAVEPVTTALPLVQPRGTPPPAEKSNSTVILLSVLLVVAMVGMAATVLIVMFQDDSESTETQNPNGNTPGSSQVSTYVPKPPPSSTRPVPAFAGCPSGYIYGGENASGRYDICYTDGVISDGFARNVAAAVTGPGSYSDVYSASRDQQYYFSCQYMSGSSRDLACGYPPTNIQRGGLVLLYPTS